MGWKENYKKYIEENEEIRCWFKVTANRKKVWNIQLWLLEEMKKICQKHNIKYYAYWWTLLWAIRHWWYIPRDDDMDIAMFREDYEKFRKIALEELPNNIKITTTPFWFSKLINTNTTALWDDSWRYKSFNYWWIWIDIFPMDKSSKFSFINKIKNIILDIITPIIFLQMNGWSTNKVAKRKRPFVPFCKLIFWKNNYNKTYKILERILKFNIFEWKNIHMFTHRFFPVSIFNNSHEIKFENTNINIPNQYETFLKITYWKDYMKPVIWEWWHNCRYSVKKSYKDIIKQFDKSKPDNENFNNCSELFLLDANTQ